MILTCSVGLVIGTLWPNIWTKSVPNFLGFSQKTFLTGFRGFTGENGTDERQPSMGQSIGPKSEGPKKEISRSSETQTAVLKRWIFQEIYSRHSAIDQQNRWFFTYDRYIIHLIDHFRDQSVVMYRAFDWCLKYLFI